MVQNDPTFGKINEAGEIARLYGVKVGEIEASFAIQTVSTGDPYIIVPFKSLKTVQ